VNEGGEVSRNGAPLCKGFREENFQGGLLYWGPRKISEVRPLGKWRGSFFLGPSYLEEFL